jgi:hypothetical protein
MGIQTKLNRSTGFIEIHEYGSVTAGVGAADVGPDVFADIGGPLGAVGAGRWAGRVFRIRKAGRGNVRGVSWSLVRDTGSYGIGDTWKP